MIERHGYKNSQYAVADSSFFNSVHMLGIKRILVRNQNHEVDLTI